MPSLCRDDGNSSSEDEGWMELADDESSIKCLFCAQKFQNRNGDPFPEAIKHINIEHDLSFKSLKSRLNMDQYSFIKLVNYIKTHKSEASIFKTATASFWEDEKYLKPVDLDNAWLMYGMW